jgi:hypothetical protein
MTANAPRNIPKRYRRSDIYSPRLEVITSTIKEMEYPTIYPVEYPIAIQTAISRIDTYSPRPDSFHLEVILSTAKQMEYPMENPRTKHPIRCRRRCITYKIIEPTFHLIVDMNKIATVAKEHPRENPVSNMTTELISIFPLLYFSKIC